MQRRIVGFHRDCQQHWVADLECGHSQNVRHDPPWQERPWVLDEAAREARLGTSLNCILCDEPPATERSKRPLEPADIAPPHLSPSAAEVYLDSLIRGLCHQGALELAERADAESTSDGKIADQF